MIIRLIKNQKKSSFHNIHGKASKNSMAAYLLLKHSYQAQDRQYKIWRNSKRIWLNFRNKILRSIKKQCKGNLVCVYCKEENLVLNYNLKNLPSHRKATLDHVIPRSLGGSEYSVDNLVVACSLCNQKKKNLLPENLSPIFLTNKNISK